MGGAFSRLPGENGGWAGAARNFRRAAANRTLVRAGFVDVFFCGAAGRSSRGREQLRCRRSGERTSFTGGFEQLHQARIEGRGGLQRFDLAAGLVEFSVGEFGGDFANLAIEFLLRSAETAFALGEIDQLGHLGIRAHLRDGVLAHLNGVGKFAAVDGGAHAANLPRKKLLLLVAGFAGASLLPLHGFVNGSRGGILRIQFQGGLDFHARFEEQSFREQFFCAGHFFADALGNRAFAQSGVHLVEQGFGGQIHRVDLERLAENLARFFRFSFFHQSLAVAHHVLNGVALHGNPDWFQVAQQRFHGSGSGPYLFC